MSDSPFLEGSGAQPLYEQLRSLAARYLSRERADHTLQPTALVHETYLRLASSTRLQGLPEDQCLFYAARAMRSVLVDHARRRNAGKRGGLANRVPLDETVAMYEAGAAGLTRLESALSELESVNPSLVRLVELRFFAGLTEQQASEALGVSPRTVRRAWAAARSWLHQRLAQDDAHD